MKSSGTSSPGRCSVRSGPDRMSRLDRLLRPKSIAVFGGDWAAAVIRQTRKMGYSGEVWPVHPKRDTVEGVPVFRSVAELPAAPDACFVGVNREATVEVVGELANRGAGGAVCFASGFREAGDVASKGNRLQTDLIAAAGEMPVLGPNCYGLINYADGALLWPDQHGGARLEEGARGVAIITQSSNIALNLTMQKRGLPLAYVLTAGNQAQTGLSQIALGLIEDDRVSALGLHIEGFDCVAGFERLAARARELCKPIVSMKVGRTEQAQLTATSHTASLAGSDVTSDAFLRRLGIARISSIPAFLEALKLLHIAGPLDGFRISSMSCSGGEAAVIADSVEGRKVHFPQLSPATKKCLHSKLGAHVTVSNPLDYHTNIWNDEAAMASAFTAFISGGFDFNLLVLDFPRGDRCSDADWMATVNAFDTALKTTGTKGGVLASLPENLPESWCDTIAAHGMVPMLGFTEALEAVEAAADIGRAWENPLPLPVIASAGATANARIMTEADAKRRLEEFGLPVPRGIGVEHANDAAAAAVSIGFPVALKALGVSHKTERGAVRLNLSDVAALESAALDLAHVGSGLLVEKMIAGSVGELIVGIVRDRQFGPVMTIGSGGVLVELLEDTRTLLLPVSRADMESALRSLRLFPLLDGYRGREKADVEAALDVLQGIARFAEEHGAAIVEMDINPLIVCETGKGAFIADALIVLEEPI